MAIWIAFADMSLPPFDHGISPYTGFTRAHWEAVADSWLSQAFAYASQNHALFHLPGRHSQSGEQSDALEGYARTFLLAAPRIVGGGDTMHLAQRYADGLVAGTRRGGNEEWLRGVDCVLPLTGETQPIVEAANIALALHLTRDHIWQLLDDREQQQVIDWLEHHARLTPWPNNWVLFTAVVEAFLSSVGVDTSSYRSDRLVHWTESWHLGDGWYTDGARRNIDYYNAWVIHPFLWAWYDMVGADRDLDGAWRWRQRFTQFGASYPRMFGANGGPVQQGRSLTYRTASLAAVWLGEMTGTSALSPGAVRRLTSGTLRYFIEAGVGVDGPLSLGWGADSYLPMTQRYSGPGSPYFAGMGFLGLALPPDHPVWTSREEAQPSEDGDAATALPGVGWLIQSTKDDGIVRLLNHGSDHVSPPKQRETDEFYAKLAYSSHTAPGCGEAFAAGVDAEFTTFDSAGVANRRRKIRTHWASGNVAASRNAYTAGDVVSASVVHGRFEVRAHLLDGGNAATVREAGVLIADDVQPQTASDEQWAYVRNSKGLTCAVIGLHGYTDAGVVYIPTANWHGDYAAVPVLRGDRDVLAVALHVLGFSADPHRDVLRWRGEVSVTVKGSQLTVAWPDGSRDFIDVATVTPPP